MWNLGEHELLKVEPLCGTLGKSGTLGNLYVEPELLRVGPLCGPWGT